MAYSTLQPGLNYFESHGGYLAYDRSLGVNFVLADPLAPAENHRAIIAEFLKSHPRTCFCQVSKPTAAILSDLGYYVNEIGADVELDLPNYDFSGPKKSKFRQAANPMTREQGGTGLGLSALVELLGKTEVGDLGHQTGERRGVSPPVGMILR